MRRRRVHHPGVDPSVPRLELSAEESHHVGRVLRLRRGDAVGVFDGRGREWGGTVVGSSGGRVEIEIGAELQDPVEPRLDVTLVQGLSRAEHLEWVLQKGTELGVRAFRPVATARSEPGRPGRVRIERWRRIVLEACKQSGRRRIPDVEEPRALLDGLPDGGLRLVLDPAAEPGSLARILAGPTPGRVAIAVGPEGGLEEGEIDALVERGWTRVGLGPRVLRTETAGIVAAALVLYAWGDLGGRADT